MFNRLKENASVVTGGAKHMFQIGVEWKVDCKDGYRVQMGDAITGQNREHATLACEAKGDEAVWKYTLVNPEQGGVVNENFRCEPVPDYCDIGKAFRDMAEKKDQNPFFDTQNREHLKIDEDLDVAQEFSGDLEKLCPDADKHFSPSREEAGKFVPETIRCLKDGQFEGRLAPTPSCVHKEDFCSPISVPNARAAPSLVQMRCSLYARSRFF
jgi:hypothetical protein